MEINRFQYLLTKYFENSLDQTEKQELLYGISHFSNEEFDKFLKTLCVFEIEYNELTPISIAWDDYIVFKNAISPEKLRYMGCFYDLTEKIYMGQ